MTMKIKIERDEKIELIRALKVGVLDTDKIPSIKKVLDNAQPAKLLTKAQAVELLRELENEY